MAMLTCRLDGIIAPDVGAYAVHGGSYVPSLRIAVHSMHCDEKRVHIAADCVAEHHALSGHGESECNADSDVGGCVD